MTRRRADSIASLRVAQLRSNVAAYLRDEMTYAEFDAVQRALWDAIHKQPQVKTRVDAALRQGRAA